MELLKINITLNPELYIKNPDSSKLGKSIISTSIEMINKMGFEEFTFKKLGAQIKSPESSIYRYFKSKHDLLIYLTSWYWAWTEYRLVLATNNIHSPKKRLEIAINLLTKPVLIDNDFTYINEILLSEIIFSESIKAYHTNKVDDENQRGFFKAYKNVVERVSKIVLEIKPGFKYPHMLISTVIEGAHHQKYFSEHLPALTDQSDDKNTITTFYTQLVFNFLK
ncbi:MAG: TetR/AcrR family transcriptional regulator [Flavobacteriales bacterium]